MGRPLLLGAAFLAVAFAIYAPALDGKFISDDGHYVAQNPYIHDLSRENVIAILNPGSVVALVVENYAPVHLLLHALEWQLFGEAVRGYHVVNVVVHTLASLLLVALMLRWGLSPLAAWLGGGLFLVHPANVEAVAWISQLKTTSAMVLCVGALLAHPRRPAVGTLLFGLALFAKPTAAVALFALAVAGWVRSGGETPAEGGWRWRWVGVWALVLVAFAVAEFWAFNQTAGQAPPIYPELAVRFRSVCAIALRYLVMAATSRGLSTFHETPPADSWLDPWWLGSLPVLALLAWRLVFTLRERRWEAVFWVWAVVSFAPICGVIPLPFPMADRYLYFILPGLIGGTALALPELASWLARRHPELGSRVAGERGAKLAVALCVVLMAFFAIRGHERARVWRSPEYMMADAELHYPEGAAAQTGSQGGAIRWPSSFMAVRRALRTTTSTTAGIHRSTLERATRW